MEPGKGKRDRHGRLGRREFAAAMAIATALASGAWVAAEAALPAMARMLSPHGINAGLILNGLWTAIAVAYLGTLVRLLRLRLADLDRPAMLALAVVGPLIVWAVLSDAIFLWRHKLPLSRSWDLPLAILGMLVAGAVLAECLLRPGRRASSED